MKLHSVILLLAGAALLAYTIYLGCEMAETIRMGMLG